MNADLHSFWAIYQRGVEASQDIIRDNEEEDAEPERKVLALAQRQAERVRAAVALVLDMANSIKPEQELGADELDILYELAMRARKIAQKVKA